MKQQPHFISHRQLPLLIDSSSTAEDLRVELRTALTTLPFHAFEACIRELLQSLGYSEVKLLDRTERRQPTRHGGRDLEATSRTGVNRTRIQVQVKQYKRPVSRRFVDELRGAILRRGGGQGLIVTTSMFSKVAHQAAVSNQVAPIRLVEGEELLDLLITQGIGVCTGQTGKALSVDAAYFASLTQLYPSRKTLAVTVLAKEHQSSARRSGRKPVATDVRPGCGSVFGGISRLATSLINAFQRSGEPPKKPQS
jgi:restriction endonuclease Mrr